MSSRSKRSGRLAAVALSLALFASACGSAATGDAAPGDSGAGGTSEATSGLPQLVGNTVSGAQLDTNDLAGQDVVVWFWAPW